MYALYDPDEWESVYYTDGGAFGCSQRRRPPEEVARIKAEKQAAREDAILAEADAIRARRAVK